MRRIRRKEKGGERQVNLFQFPHVPWPACPFTYSLHPTCGDPKGVAYSLKPVSIADVRRRSTRCSPLRLSLTLSVKPLFVQDSPKDPPRFESNAAISPRFKRFLERGGTRFRSRWIRCFRSRNGRICCSWNSTNCESYDSINVNRSVGTRVWKFIYFLFERNTRCERYIYYFGLDFPLPVCTLEYHFSG